MGLRIQTTGLEQYAPGGLAHIKALIIGGPGVGKTRWSSYFPRALYANCEGGLASVADRGVQFVDISNSKQMLDLLVELDAECNRPLAARHFDTIVIDTIDAFQRKVQDEWLLKNPNEAAFRGFEAWGYLDSKMQMLLTRLLNLKINVIVLCHYEDKIITEGAGNDAVQRREYQLQLSGKVKERIFNDFDLVGWMDTHYEAEAGKRVQKRSLTFQPTPDKPFLKDRLNATPEKIDVSFSEADYFVLFESIVSRLDEFKETQDFGEIPSYDGDETPIVIPPIQSGGALPEITPQEIPLIQHDKVTLQKMARDLGIKFAGNIVKSELVTLIEDHLKPKETGDIPEANTPVEDVAPEPVVTTEEASVEAPEPEVIDEVPDGVVDEVTGVFTETPSVVEDAVAAIQDVIGAQDLSKPDPKLVDTPVVVSSESAPSEQKATTKTHRCEVCDKDLAQEPDTDRVTLAWIKVRKRLCNEHWREEQIARGFIKA